jgi:hypothetical protein
MKTRVELDGKLPHAGVHATPRFHRRLRFDGQVKQRERGVVVWEAAIASMAGGIVYFECCPESLGNRQFVKEESR